MTFTPTPKADLQSPSDLSDYFSALAQQVISRLHHSAQAEDWAAAAIADIYGRLPGIGGSWLWSSAPFGTDPGVGKVLITVSSGNNRTIALSKTDGDGNTPSLALLAQGSTLVLTDDPSTPPTTAFRQYLVTANPTDHGSWVSLLALRVATFGAQDTPLPDSRVRVLLR